MQHVCAQQKEKSDSSCPCSAAGLCGTLADEATDSFRFYEEQLRESQDQANAESGRERAACLTVIEPYIFALLRDLMAPDKTGETEFNVLTKT